MRGYRAERLAELIHAEVAPPLREEVKDHRLVDVSITHVEVSKDLKRAVLHWMPLGGGTPDDELIAALDDAGRALRGPIGRALRTRHAPELLFRVDDHTENAVRVTSMLDRIGRELPRAGRRRARGGSVTVPVDKSGAFLVIDKPPGITSHDVVAAVRAVTGVKKVGHTGTLDPFATGVLPLALGAATRLIQFLDESIKVYDATIRLGSATDTGDPTGEVVRTAPVPEVSDDDIAQVLQGFLGERMQVPPAYSAVKVRGKPMYAYARKGEAVEAPARPITIHDLELLSHDGDEFRILITCSRGTYARVLADEIAVALGTAGHLVALNRPRSGPFHLEDALSMPQLAQLVAAEPGHEWQDTLLSRGRGGVRVQWRRARRCARPWRRGCAARSTRSPSCPWSTPGRWERGERGAAWRLPRRRGPRRRARGTWWCRAPI